MTSEEMIRLCKQHTLYTWAAQSAVNPIPVARAEGVYFYTPDGKRFLDWNSQLMCNNVGHSHPKVLDAMRASIDAGLQFVYPQTATEPRARLGQKLASLTPGDLDVFFFTLGGAEANENAIKIARAYTGRNKILARYRSYHGGTNAAMQLTGDPRRLANEPGMPGVVHVMDPWPYTWSWGDNDEEITARNLAYLEEVIQYEGADKIAAMFIETVTGTNGILPPPAGYLQGLRALLDKYGILLVCDEVMAGFGRTGKMFAFEHGGIVPDLVTMAKGLTAAYFPLGAVGMRRKIADHFEKNTFWGGLTYNSHPLGLATALAVLDVLESEDLVGNAARLESVMRREMTALKERHRSVKEFRVIGLFGIVELQKDSKGTPFAPYGSAHPAMGALNKAFLDAGLFTFVNRSSFMCNPPLTITEAQIAEAFAIIDRCLGSVDAACEG
jgi:taurine--2-oxoglutarate transaminase